MSKRQGGRPKQANDFYPTPYKAVLPLIPFLPPNVRFFEPCAGAADLVVHLMVHRLRYAGACDIDPRTDLIVRKRDATSLTEADLANVDVFITNPPHTHKWLAPILEHLRLLRPTWLLLPLDWFATQQAAPFLAYCTDIVVIGRMKMDIPGSYTDGFDNFAWARFQKELAGQTEFHGKR